MELLFDQFYNLYFSSTTGKILAKSKYNSYSTKQITCTYDNIRKEFMENLILGVFATKNRNGVEVSKFFTGPQLSNHPLLPDAGPII